jgi:hypothetical protein
LPDEFRVQESAIATEDSLRETTILSRLPSYGFPAVTAMPKPPSVPVMKF